MFRPFIHNSNKLLTFLLCLILDSFLIHADPTLLSRAKEAENIGDIPLAIGEYYHYLQSYDENAPKETQLKDAEIFKHAGDLCQSSRRLIEALEFYTLAFEAADRAGNREIMISSLGNIGNIYSAFDDYERAVTYYERVYEEALRSNSRELQIKALINLVAACTLKGDTEKGQENFQKLKMVESEDFPELEYHLNSIQGLIASASNNTSGAIFYHKKARRTAEEDNLDSIYLANQDMLIGFEYENLNSPDSARFYLNRALGIATIKNYAEQNIGIYEGLERLSKMTGDSVAEIKYKAAIKQLNDSIYNRREFNSARNRLTSYEERIQATKISNLNTRVSILWIVIGSGALLLIIVFLAVIIITRRNRELKFANEVLMEKNHELIKNEQQMRELREKYLASLPENEDPSLEEEDNSNTPQMSDQALEDDNENHNGVSTYLNPTQVEILLKKINSVLDDGKNIYNPDFSLNILAQKVKSNTKYVSWVINESYGCNFKTLLNERRIREASRRLEDKEQYGHLTIQAIAEGVGYRTAASFIQSFKKIVGMTPSVYQKIAEKTDK